MKTERTKMMKQMVDTFIIESNSRPRTFPISKQEYLQWAAGFIFDGLRDQRYGQSFCNRFEIHDNILFYSRTVAEADRYILENYVE
jgi:hypothetical protein